MVGEASWADETPSPAEERPCVLLVDDDADVARTVSQILRQEQYEIVVTPSAGEALRAVAERTYDVVLIELAFSLPPCGEG
jgi:CheY-like chemotaxis protein